jgi:hypothetical protein
MEIQLEKNDVMFFHGTTIDNSRFTISGILNNDVLNLGIAVCAKGDQFVRAKGRVISTERLLHQRRLDLEGRIQVKLLSTSDNKRAFSAFTDTVSKYNSYTKKELLKEFGLKKTDELFVNGIKTASSVRQYFNECFKKAANLRRRYR